MDTVVRYWHNISKQVSVRYRNSSALYLKVILYVTGILGAYHSNDILAKFSYAVSLLDPKGTIQVSMDGSNTNLKFLNR